MPPRVLVVEDDPVQAEVLSLMLEHLGASVQLARDGAEAVDAVQSARYALVLMDCVMPVLNGVEATRSIRRWEYETGQVPLPIVAVTASGMADECRGYREAGMDEVMLKPISAGALAIVLVRHAVARSSIEVL